MSDPKNRILGNGSKRSEKKPPVLFEIYEDIYKLVEKRHPELYNKAKDRGIYHVVDSNIIDAYKSVLHLMLLKQIPGFEFYDEARAIDAIEAIEKKYGSSQYYETARVIRSELLEIIDKHCNLVSNKGISQ